jgi:hypothetical protein
MLTLRSVLSYLDESRSKPDRYMSFFAGFMFAVLLLTLVAMG